MTEAMSLSWRPARGGPVSTRVRCDDESRVGEARRAADAIGRSCGLDEQARGTLAIVVTEAATNLARHAKGGVILLRDMEWSGVPGIEMLAVDTGPGMQHLDRFFADGFSTGGTSGAGLGAMRRQAHELDIYSRPGQGTVLLARVFATQAEKPSARLLDAGAVCLPIDGETACGDGWGIRQQADRATVLIVDGLGHGPNAAAAADTALDVFQKLGSRTPMETVQVIHEALRATRGAAVAVADVRRTADGATVELCGAGNTAASIIGPSGSRSLPSMNGTAGLNVRGLKSFTQPWRTGDLLIMHTDGLTSRWRLEDHPGVRGHDPAVVAAVLQRDATRGRDDVTVLAFALAGEGRA